MTVGDFGQSSRCLSTRNPWPSFSSAPGKTRFRPISGARPRCLVSIKSFGWSARGRSPHLLSPPTADAPVGARRQGGKNSLHPPRSSARFHAARPRLRPGSPHHRVGNTAVLRHEPSSVARCVGGRPSRSRLHTGRAGTRWHRPISGHRVVCPAVAADSSRLARAAGKLTRQPLRGAIRCSFSRRASLHPREIGVTMGSARTRGRALRGCGRNSPRCDPRARHAVMSCSTSPMVTRPFSERARDSRSASSVPAGHRLVEHHRGLHGERDGEFERACSPCESRRRRSARAARPPRERGKRGVFALRISPLPKNRKLDAAPARRARHSPEPKIAAGWR